MYAVVETGGKQYRVAPGQTVDVARLDVAEGDAVNLDRVLLITQGDKVTVGNPTISGARVVATSQGNGRAKKIIVFRYKPKVRYSKKTGHRQPYTRLTVDKIIKPGTEAKSAEGPSQKEGIASGT
ncbi:MAG: 50S ribosomal protein L21 [Dehalococcoidales bacterium]|nr:50S ribosomal protein L21 [Dehalococcoidales bacterium]